MNDPFDDLFDAWCQTAKALSEAFLYDNQLPIDETTRQFECVWGDLRQLRTLREKAKGKPLSVRAQVKFDRLLQEKPQERLEKLIEHLGLFRTEWTQENHPVNQVTKKLGSSSTRAEWNREHTQAKDKELATAELLCRRLLEEFISACPGLDARKHNACSLSNMLLVVRCLRTANCASGQVYIRHARCENVILHTMSGRRTCVKCFVESVAH